MRSSEVALSSSAAQNSTTIPPEFWWESLPDEVECPITLEPVNTLPYPPFVLRQKHVQLHQGGEQTEDIQYFFDGHALASYIVSRGIFQNPLTRQNLTYDDCRRLDQYLEEYCYNDPNNDKRDNHHQSTTKKRFDVLEAFALRESVQVRTSTATNLTQSQLDGQRRRAEFLRSEATAALSGLFVYGTANRQRQRDGNNHHLNSNTRGRPANAAAALQRQQQQPARLAFGFDLNRPVHDTANFVDEDFGMVVIDDDDALVVEREQEAYQELQEAFPHLSTTSTMGIDAQHHSYSPQTPQANLLAMNKEKLEQIRQKAEQERIDEEQRLFRIQQAQRQLARQAQQRREERKNEREALKAKAQAEHHKQQLEQQEVARARAEIEQWREEQWERLRHIAEREQEQRLEQERNQRALLEQRKQEQLQHRRQEEEKESKNDDGDDDEDREAKQKAAKAAKRKRAKERKKQEKAQERREQQAREKQAAIEAKKKASDEKCAACQEGILGVPFERFGHHFCSPKCARAGPAGNQ